jgi:hypothetical protein
MNSDYTSNNFCPTETSTSKILSRKNLELFFDNPKENVFEPTKIKIIVFLKKGRNVRFRGLLRFWIILKEEKNGKCKNYS